MSESGNVSDNEAALRAARKSLPFPALLARLGTPGVCPFCGDEKASGLIRQPVTTRKIDRATIAAVEAVDIVKVVSANLQLKRQGANWVACCPFHNEKHPSFNVHPSKNMFKCFGCKEGGGPIQFIRKMAGLDFVEAVEKLAAENGIPIRYETSGEKTLWRCTNAACPSGTGKEGEEVDEVGLVGLWESRKQKAESGKAESGKTEPMSRKEAFKAYLKMAAVKSEVGSQKPEEKPLRFKPVAAQRAEVGSRKSDTSPQPSPNSASDAELGEGEDTVLPNPVLVEKNMEHLAPALSPFASEANAEGEKADDGEELIWQCIEVLRKENRASAALLQRKLKVGAKADGLLAELEKRGIIGPANGTKSRTILKLPKPRPQLIKIKIGEEVHVVDASTPDTSPQPSPQSGEGEKMAGEEFAAAGFAGRQTDTGELLGRAALEYFYGQQTLLPADDDQLWFKRGLATATNLALGTVSSRQENYDLLQKMTEMFPWDELEASGLWLPEDRREKKPRRRNAQFCGYGQLAKKPKAERKHKNDKAIWGYAYPPLIAYFDEAGKILKLRPHKGGAPGTSLCGASRIYVPRDFRKIIGAPHPGPLPIASQRGEGEEFSRVVICEGEFKAQAIWQTLGAGRTDGEKPIGVCAIPGITYGKNYDIREDLQAWLRAVRCKAVDVAFDDEDKSDKEHREDRHKAIIWAKFLAASLARDLQIQGRVCVLPRTWRIRDGKPDVKGKADWDGALAQIIHGKKHSTTNIQHATSNEKQATD